MSFTKLLLRTFFIVLREFCYMTFTEVTRKGRISLENHPLRCCQPLAEAL